MRLGFIEFIILIQGLLALALYVGLGFIGLTMRKHFKLPSCLLMLSAASFAISHLVGSVPMIASRFFSIRYYEPLYMVSTVSHFMLHTIAICLLVWAVFADRAR